MSNVADPPLRNDPSSDTAGLRLRRFGRRQVIGVVFGVVGLALLALVAPNITSDRRAFAFERPPDPLQFEFNPVVLVVVIACLYLVAAAASFLPAGRDRIALIAQLVAIASAIPLIIGLALALSTAEVTNVTNLLDESLLLATPIALGAMTGLWCERSGIINIGIEGMMLGSAGIGYMTYAVLGSATGTGWLWFSILIAILAGARSPCSMRCCASATRSTRSCLVWLSTCSHSASPDSSGPR